MRRLCVLLPLLLSSCASWQDVPDDVKFVAFHYGTGPYKTNARGEIIDVEIETNLNYMNHVGPSSAVSGRFYFCDQRSINVQGLGGLGLYKYMDKWVSVDDGIRDDSPPPYRYHTAIHAAIHDKAASADARSTILDYDLREAPRDLCFFLDAGYYYHEKSNVVRIPKEELIKFFAEHPRPQTGQ